MRLLDLFCGAGGAAMGYYQAGFTDIVGIDANCQKRYPFEFIQGDALEFCEKYGKDFDIIHASPPCQAYSVTKSLHNNKHPELIEVTRNLLKQTGKKYIIENVAGVKFILDNPIMLCGTMFDLRVLRHRYFETFPVIWFPPRQCQHIGKASGNKNYKGKKRTLEFWEYLTITGHDFIVNDAQIAMGINWMRKDELSQAIPPAYTKWIGQQILGLI